MLHHNSIVVSGGKFNFEPLVRPQILKHSNQKFKNILLKQTAIKKDSAMVIIISSLF